MIFQSSVCSSGSLLGVLSGSQYNRCWTVHNAVSEAMERLFLSLFLRNHDVPDDLSNMSDDPKLSTELVQAGAH